MLPGTLLLLYTRYQVYIHTRPVRIIACGIAAYIAPSFLANTYKFLVNFPAAIFDVTGEVKDRNILRVLFFHLTADFVLFPPPNIPCIWYGRYVL